MTARGASKSVVLWAWLAAIASAGSPLDEAEWVWHTRDTAIEREKEHFFAKEFVVEKAKVKGATLQITVDGSYALSVNGKEVGADDKWLSLESYDITPHLAEGKNRLLVKAVPNTWHAGLFVAGTIELADGTAVPIVSDATWDAWTAEDKTVKKADVIVKGVDGGFWCCVTPLEMPELFHRLNTEVVAPHIAWATPYAGKKLKVLALHSRYAQRDTVELMHRFDVDLNAVFSDPSREDGTVPFFRSVKGALRKDVATNISKALDGAYDAILVGPAPADVFPKETQEKLKALVAGGAGLVYSGHLPDKELEKVLTAAAVAEKPPFLATGTPFEKLPGFGVREKDKERDFSRVVSLFQHGKGRVVRLRYGGRSLLTPPDGSNDTRYEYYQSFIIKALLWAAKREPTVLFEDFPATLALDRDSGKPLEMAFTLKNAGRPGAFDVSLAIRPPDRLFAVPGVPVAKPGLQQVEGALRPIHAARTSVTVKGSAPVAFLLPTLPAGSYFVDVQVASGTRQVNWATSFLTVESKLRIAGVTIQPPWLDLTAKRVPPLNVAATLTQAAPEDAVVHFSVIDNYDRLLHQEPAKVATGGEKAEIAASLPHMPTILGKVRAELRVGQDRADIAFGRFTTVHRDWDRFAFCAWAGYGGRGGSILSRQLAALGLDAYRGRAGSLDFLEIADFAALPGYASMRGGPIDTDPKVIEKARAAGREIGEKNLPFDPIAYVSGDEATYTGGHNLPARVADFRKSLQKQYGAIEALNGQWDTSYASFEEVPAIVDKVEKDFLARAEPSRNYSPIVDQWRENHRVFAERFRLHRDAIRQGDPHARVGTESPLWPWSSRCFDWFTLVRDLGLFSPYGRDGDIQTYEYGSSFGTPDMLLGMTYGGYAYNGFIRRPEFTDEEFQHWRPWSALLRGYNCVWWYSLGAGFESGTGPGLQPYPAFVEACEQIATIRKGYHTLLRRTERQHDGIAIHYSVASNIVADRINDFGLVPWNVHMLIRILQDYAPRRYEFVSTEQILDGGLKPYKVLILPLSQAIGAAEAEALERFVRKGGLLIADVRPGLTDEHGKFGANPLVPKLFGITYKKELGRASLSTELSSEYKGVAFKNKSLSFAADPAVALDGATALFEQDGVPLVTSNPVGKGTAICLNIPFNFYRHYPTPDTLYFYLADEHHGRLIGNLLTAIFKAHRIERTLNVEPAKGRWPWGLEARHAVDGRAHYVGLTKRRAARDEGDHAVVVRAPRPGHVYRMFDGKHLGRQEQWEAVLHPADVQLYSILPYEVEGLKVTLRRESVRRGAAIAGKVSIRKGWAWPVRHIVHLEVTRPDGQAVRYLARNLETQGGSASFSIPLALNEPRGTWTLTFTDVATRRAATAKAEVR